MIAFIRHFLFEFRSGIRNRTLLLMTYLFPLGFYFLVGYLMTAVNPSFRETLLPAMLILSILSGTILSLPDPLVSARRAGIFRSYRINGIPTAAILLIPIFSSLFHLILMATFIGITAPLLFHAPLPANWIGFILIFLLMTLTCTGLGLLIGVVSKSTQLTVLWSQLIFIPSMILGGLMLPLSVLPHVMKKIALLLPTSHAMNAFRGLAYGYTPDFNPFWSIVILLSSIILSFSLALRLFNWQPQETERKKGAIWGFLVIVPYLVGIILIH